MHCFLHIGTEKTGTTSIQSFLCDHRGPLLAKGILFPESVGRPNNRALPVAAYSLERRDDYTRRMGIDSDVALADHQRQILHNFHSEISAKAEAHKITKLLCSSEQIQSRLTSDEEVYKLRQILLGVGATTFTIIVYLRRPAEIANSLYSTSLRQGNSNFAPPRPTEPYYRNVCNHRATLERYSRVFGAASIVARLYDKSAWRSSSLLCDFCHVIGYPITSDVAPHMARNVAFSPLAAELLARLNRELRKLPKGERAALRDRIVPLLEQHLCDGGKKYRMPGWLYAAYDREFADSDEWVRSRFFSDRPSLFPAKCHASAPPLSYEGAELDQIAAMILALSMPAK